MKMNFEMQNVMLLERFWQLKRGFSLEHLKGTLWSFLLNKQVLCVYVHCSSTKQGPTRKNIVP